MSARASPRRRANSRAFLSADYRSRNGPHSGANGCVRYNFSLVRTLAVDFAFFAGSLDGGIARNAGDGADQRNPTVASFNFIQRQLHLGAGIAVLKAADVTFDGAAFWNNQTAGSSQIFAKFGLEVLAFLHLLGVEGIFQLDNEPRPVRNGIWRRSVG